MPGEGLGLQVQKAEADEEEGYERMVVKGFQSRGTLFEKKGVRPGDVVVAVQSESVVKLPYASVMEKVVAAKAGGRIMLKFLNFHGYGIMIPQEHVSIIVLALSYQAFPSNHTLTTVTMCFYNQSPGIQIPWRI